MKRILLLSLALTSLSLGQQTFVNGKGGGITDQTAFKTALTLENVENTALSTWSGSTNIVSLGTITTGTWTGTAIGDSYISSAATWNGKQNAISFGTGVLTSLGVNIGSTGAPVLFDGPGGTPSSITLTNATGTAAGLTAGNVTTNANLTGHVTSTGNAAVLGSFTIAQLSTAVSDADVAPLLSPAFTGEPTVTSTSMTAMRVSGTGSSAATWKGRIVAGGETVAFLMGEYNNLAWLGAHNAALNSWADFYVNPDGAFSLHLGKYSGSTLMQLNNSTGVISVNGVGVDLGNADTTITRSAAGVIAVEGVDVLLNGGALGTPSSGSGANLTSLNGSNISSGTIDVARLGSGAGGGKYLRDDNTWQTISGGGDALVANPLSQFAATTSLQLKNTISDETGSGTLVFADTPTLVTPALGVATATSVNKVAITAPATSATLTIADGKTLTASNSIDLAGTDSTTMTFPTTSARIAREDFRTQATAAGTTTLVVGDASVQEFTGSTTQTCRLPTTGVVAGQTFRIINNSTGVVTVQSSGANTILTMTGVTSSRVTAATFTALIATPTTAAHWSCQMTVPYGAATTTMLVGGGITASPTWTTVTGSGSPVMGTSPTFGTSVVGGASFSVFNTASTTISAFGAATTMTVGGTPTGAVTHNYSTNATATATTKTINFGTAGASGSTTNINIGSAVAGSAGTTKVQNSVNLATTARTSGATSYFTVTTPADTARTASTESIGANFTAATRQWSTGALTTQRERVFQAPTYAFVGASTLTNAVNVDINEPIAGANATITNKIALKTDSLMIGPFATAAIVDRITAATTTWNPGSLAAGASEKKTAITLTGVSVGDIVTAAHTTIISSDWDIQACVTAADTVEVKITNNTGGIVDLGSGTLRVMCIRTR